MLNQDHSFEAHIMLRTPYSDCVEQGELFIR
jgi:hypothetical protein